MSDDKNDLSPEWAEGYDKGYSAEKTGASIDDNPYNKGTPEHAEWEKGYTEGYEDYEADQEDF